MSFFKVVVSRAAVEGDARCTILYKRSKDGWPRLSFARGNEGCCNFRVSRITGSRVASGVCVKLRAKAGMARGKRVAPGGLPRCLRHRTAK